MLRASENVEAFLGVAPDQVLGLPVRHLGLRYPASDIPAQARALYERSYLRTISDVDAVPVPVASGAAAGGHALDLSMSVLRSVSPVHLEYLRNMGVRASMSVSILRGGRLWGLFACHHRQPRRVGYETLSTVELFAHMFSHLLEEHAREDDAVFDALILEMRDKLVGAAAGSMLDRVPDLLATLGELIPCDGIAVIAGGDAMLAGWTPTRAEVLALMPFLDQGDRLVSSTNALGALFAPAAAYAYRCAGLLALRISGEPRGYVLLFRREIVETIVWAGEPTKKVVAGPDGMRLSPRRSFAAWSEDVRGRSARWTRSELRAAEAVRTMLVEVTLEASDQAHVARTGDGQRQEIVIAELNHRVRNMPLTQFDLADTLGLSVVHMNRTLQLLRQRGLFVWKGRVVTILDRPDLLKLAEFDPRYLRFQPDVTGAPARAA